MTLYLLNYNNYYNRIIKRFDTINEYEPFTLTTFSNISFNPGDNLQTSQIINFDPIDYDNTFPNYLLVVDAYQNIVGRWFIINQSRMRAGQYQISLLRDVIADWYNEVLKAPLFVEKAELPTSSNLIFNNEDMTYNQIKVEEKLLKDKTVTPWIVGYVASDFAGEEINIPAGYVSVSYTLDSLEDYTYNAYTTDPFKGNYVANETVFSSFYQPEGSTWNVSYDWTPDKQKAIAPDSDTLGYTIRQNVSLGCETSKSFAYLTDNVPNFFNQLAASTADFTADYSAYISGGHSASATETLLAERNKIIQVGSTYYKINVTYEGRSYEYARVQASSALGSMFKQTINFVEDVVSQDAYFRIAALVPKYRVSYSEVTIESYTLTIPQDRIHLKDAPYDMFCMPFNAIPIEVGNTSAQVELVDEYFKFATVLAEKLGSNLYDLQLVPYCPLPPKMLYGSAGDILIRPKVYYSAELIPKAVQYFANGDKKVGALFWCENSTFSTNLTFPKVSLPTDPVEFKVESECTFYRVCSPNYNGVFEISAAKNRGLSGFTADCSYKPFAPYIKVAPVFGGLYGESYGDARGLICGGDFSLPLISDAWEQYQINNKNYADIFARQIENMEVNNSYQRLQSILGAATGTLTGTIAGATFGGLTGNPVAAGIGAAVGGITSAAGGIADVYIGEQLRKETLDYTKDQFGYQLGNIRALPNSLTRVSAYNANNKLFPFVEKYTATEEEKQALRDKIKYNGMTVMKIGTILDYIQDDKTYIKGKLIRLEGSFESYPEYNITIAISNELNKGVFI